LAAAMLAWPSRRKRLIARLRSVAITRGGVPGPDQETVFPVGDVADPVEPVLYLPVASMCSQVPRTWPSMSRLSMANARR
jgi:hypothetical protein